MSRLRKISMDIGDRDYNGTMVYINGLIYKDISHGMAINEYLKDNTDYSLNEDYLRPIGFAPDDKRLPNDSNKEDIETINDNIYEMAFAHMSSPENAIYIERDTLQNVDINTVAKALKTEYPNYNIYVEETRKKIARERIAMDINSIKNALNQVSIKGRNILKELEDFKFTSEQTARLLNNDQSITQGLIKKRTATDEISNKLYQIVFDIENLDITKSFNEQKPNALQDAPQMPPNVLSPDKDNSNKEDSDKNNQTTPPNVQNKSDNKNNNSDNVKPKEDNQKGENNNE